MSPRSFRDDINGIEDCLFDGTQFGVAKTATLRLKFASDECGDGSNVVPRRDGLAGWPTVG